ncbi:MAG: 3,4-dihydroxy-2-butanone-4-phosphate synthase [Myxococcales bacterium]|nr:3,4-dihydroxy-2-butanone-4-phosphate synthase [Myxococcales bacterium]
MKKADSESIARVERALDEIRNGRMVILVDDEDRENEGDLVMAAELVTPAAINFMARYGRGLICLSLTPDRCDKLGLQMMVNENQSGFGTAFTVSIEAARGVTTGISAADRAHTVRTAVAPDARAEDLARPGHIFPLRAKAGGVLVRTGQTEGSVDLARLAGLAPAGVICEIMNDDGTMARRPQLEVFAQTHDLLILSIADLIRYRLNRERLVEATATAEIEIAEIGRFRAVTYRTVVDDLEHLALVKGQPLEDEAVLGRVHQENVLGDVFRIAPDDSRWKLEYALRRMEEEGCGVLVYLQKPAPRLENQLHLLEGRAPRLRTVDRGAIGLPPDLREFGIGAQILLDQGVRKLRLMTSSPSRIKGIEGYGLRVVETLAFPPRLQVVDANAKGQQA